VNQDNTVYLGSWSGDTGFHEFSIRSFLFYRRLDSTFIALNQL
jgi:hypothetical protein